MRIALKFAEILFKTTVVGIWVLIAAAFFDAVRLAR